nr:unnamed protein product [Callosobruchus chinensis]
MNYAHMTKHLKKLNKFIHAPHFKLEDYRSLLKLLSHNSYLGNIDMKDAYYMIAVNDNYEKYLRFLFKDKRYQFNWFALWLEYCTIHIYKTVKASSDFASKIEKHVIYYILDDINLYN